MDSSSTDNEQQQLGDSLDSAVSTDQQQPEQNQQTQELQNWDSDARFESEWGKDPNKLYASFIEREKSFNESQEKIQSFESKLAEMQEYSDKISPAVQFLEQMSQHPEYSKRFSEFVDSIQREERQIKYGDLPPSVVEQLEKSEQMAKRLELLEQEREDARIQSEYSNALNDFDSFCKNNGINWTTKEQFLQNMAKTVRNPDHLRAEFYSHIIPMLQKRTENGIINNISNANSRATFSIPSNRTVSSQSNGMSLKDVSSRLADIFLKK